jgi:hypothetical protein
MEEGFKFPFEGFNTYCVCQNSAFNNDTNKCLIENNCANITSSNKIHLVVWGSLENGIKICLKRSNNSNYVDYVMNPKEKAITGLAVKRGLSVDSPIWGYD